MLKDPDIYPAVVSRLDDECRGGGHAAAAFLGAEWWPSHCHCDFCYDESESEGQACGSVKSMESDFGSFMEYYEGRYIHQHIDNGKIQLVPSVNPRHLIYVDSAC